LVGVRWRGDFFDFTSIDPRTFQGFRTLQNLYKNGYFKSLHNCKLVELSQKIVGLSNIFETTLNLKIGLLRVRKNIFWGTIHVKKN
jgi:hypothetical protein